MMFCCVMTAGGKASMHTHQCLVGLMWVGSTILLLPQSLPLFHVLFEPSLVVTTQIGLGRLVTSPQYSYSQCIYSLLALVDCCGVLWCHVLSLYRPIFC